MANTDNNTIGISISSTSPYIEGIVNGAEPVMPGEILQLQPDGTYAAAPIADTPSQRNFATENVYSGGTIDDVYLQNSRIMIRSCRGGDIVLAWLAPGQTVLVGDWLAPEAGSGSLVNSVIWPVAIAMESLSPVGTRARIVVTVL
jgi:hypothetical protein